MKIVSLIAIAAIAGNLISASARADERPENNIFHADMSHSDLASAITAFQDVCMPFVLHQTELPQAENWRYRTALMTAQGYTRVETVQKTIRVTVEPSREEWKPRGQRIGSANNFTVFNGMSDQVVRQTQTVIAQTGEIDMRAYVPAKHKTVTVPSDTYVDNARPELTAVLDWNYPSQNDPGKSCAITLTDITLDATAFEEAFIAKDKDWAETFYYKDKHDRQWTQCVKDAEDDFKFTAEHYGSVIRLSMTRSDFYKPTLCN